MKDENEDKAGAVAGSNGKNGGMQKEIAGGSQKKENVVFLGLQKIPKGGSLVLVNNEKGSTVAFNPAEHNIINMDGYIRFIIGAIARRNG